MPQYPLKVKEVPIEKGKKPSGFLFAHIYDATGVKLSSMQTISKGINNSYPAKVAREDLPEAWRDDDRWRQMPPESPDEPPPTTPDPGLKAPGVEPRKNGNGKRKRI